jgi:CBS domain-containing protein
MARDLIPPGQDLQTIPASTPAVEALEVMAEHEINQLPVIDEGRVTGLFTWRSFSTRVADVGRLKISPSAIQVRDCLEAVEFIDPEEHIDVEVKWEHRDHVLVGSPERIVGVLTRWDVMGRLRSFAEAFVLVYEIEQELRTVITTAVAESILQAAIEELYVDHDRPGRPVTALEDFAFRQYRDLVCSRRNWSHFEAAFDTRRDLLDADFVQINDLRNVIFHFRQTVGHADLERLRRFRDRMRAAHERLVRSQEDSR